MSTDPRYKSHAWRQTRKAVLARDRHECQVKLEGCTKVAKHVDHITPVADGGSFFLHSNLRASCGHCNVSLRNQRIAELARQARQGSDPNLRPQGNYYKPDPTWTAFGIADDGSYYPSSGIW